MENKVSIEIPAADLAAAKAALMQVQQILAPYLIALTPEQRKTLPKMGDGTEPFVGKVMDYIDSNAQFLPSFVDPVEMKKDWALAEGLSPLVRMAQQILDGLSDTSMLAGSEAYVGALSYYNSAKQGAKVNAPEAKAVVEDLSKRFVGQGKKVATA